MSEVKRIKPKRKKCYYCDRWALRRVMKAGEVPVCWLHWLLGRKKGPKHIH